MNLLYVFTVGHTHKKIIKNICICINLDNYIHKKNKKQSQTSNSFFGYMGESHNKKLWLEKDVATDFILAYNHITSKWWLNHVLLRLLLPRQRKSPNLKLIYFFLTVICDSFGRERQTILSMWGFGFSGRLYKGPLNDWEISLKHH